jgi:L-aminopeptidase/D-esterase-like protein
MTADNTTLTAVRGITVGHATDHEAATGCTVVLGPFRGAVDVRGLASGTRQLDALSPLHIAPEVDAITLTGGSAYGLAVADGVARWLEERGRGFDTGVARVAIVPTAVIFDLGQGVADRWPDAEMGRAACEAAGAGPVEEGRVGAGTGATVGKVRGRSFAAPGGLGSFAVRIGEHTVGALAVVNAFGDVLDGAGRIIAGARGDDGEFIDTAARIRKHGSSEGFRPRPGTSTTLGVVATDAGLGRTALQLVARQTMNAIVRRVAPSNTPFDGDLVFACATGERSEREEEPSHILRLGLAAEWALAQAIERAVEPRESGDSPILTTD